MQNKILKQEKLKLQDSVKRVVRAKDFLTERLKVLGQGNLNRLKELRENPETSGTDFFLFLEQLHQENLTFNIKDKYQQIEELSFLEKEPYFARIDLFDNEKGSLSNLYIGKFGYTEEKPIITDWRAKIASVYYRYRYPQKNVKYDTPEGIKVRDLRLKRTFDVEEGKLLKYYNNDLQLDESAIIKEKIEKRTGGVLEDIIATIQESQLDIIEADPRQICIVQGCVGSGKSTVAIHKLSHIFFNYAKLITPQRSLLIAKNQILVSYLSTLFPKLGIFDINYKTIRELIVNLIFREKLKIEVDLDKSVKTAHFKIENIRKIYQKIEHVHKTYDQKISELFSLEDYESFGGFKYSKNETPFENLSELISELEEELSRQKDSVEENPKSIKAVFHKENVKILKKLITKIKKYRLEIKQKVLKRLLKDLRISTNEKLGYLESLIYVYVYLEIVGLNKFKKYEYCIVDEGQDFSLLEYLVLQKLVLRERFCILGDLNQGYSDEGITSWEDISLVIKEAKKARVFRLETNYRSTRPIITMARSILKPYTKKYLPKSINRVGKEPQINGFTNQKEMLKSFRKKIISDLKKTDKTVGIIAFDKQTLSSVLKIVWGLNTSKDRVIVLEKNTNINYTSKGIYFADFEDCKGLEFSQLYVFNLNIDHIDNIIEAKKAFIAVTRAMNELNVYYIK